MSMIEATANPDPSGEIRAMRSRRIPESEGVSELVDNSLDAGATQVVISYMQKSRELMVQDNGSGCTNHLAMVQKGNHHRHKTTKLGRFGVGLKDVSAAWGERLIIGSATSDSFVSVKVDWRDRERNGHWRYCYTEYPRGSSRELEQKLLNTTGMTVRIIAAKDRIRRPRIKSLIHDLALTFSPAIREGRQILVLHGGKRYPVPAYQHPLMYDSFTDEIAIGKKLYRVTAGVLQEDQRHPGRGFIISYGHRVIQMTVEPCREYLSSRFYGYVELLGQGWHLSDHKNAIVAGEAALWDSLYKRCLEPLQRAMDAAVTLDIRGLEQAISNELTSRLRSSYKKKKAKRKGASEPRGRVVPTGKGGPHEQAKNTQKGNRFRDKFNGRSIHVHFVDGIFGDPMAVVAINQNAVLIELNVDHNYIHHLRSVGESSVLLTQFCADTLAHHYATHEDDRQLMLPFADKCDDAFNQARSVFHSVPGSDAAPPELIYAEG